LLVSSPIHTKCPNVSNHLSFYYSFFTTHLIPTTFHILSIHIVGPKSGIEIVRTWSVFWYEVSESLRITILICNSRHIYSKCTKYSILLQINPSTPASVHCTGLQFFT
jgi:hypothetical protein